MSLVWNKQFMDEGECKNLNTDLNCLIMIYTLGHK